ncbi:unnamed protein product, partial [marine sediment metagenome]
MVNAGGFHDMMEFELTDVDKPFKLQGWAAEFIELTCLGIPYRIPPRRRRKTN